MSIQLCNELKMSETRALSTVELTTTSDQSQQEWYKWKVIYIVACIFFPLLVTIPLIFHANQKMAEAAALEYIALGIKAYNRRDWNQAIEHLEQLNDSPLRDVFKKKISDKLPSRLNEEDETELGTSIMSEARREVEAFGMRLCHPSDPAVSAIQLSCHKGLDNMQIVLGTLIGCAYLHQAIDETGPQKTPNKLQIKILTILSAQYLGCTRGAINLAKPDFERVRQVLRRI